LNSITLLFDSLSQQSSSTVRVKRLPANPHET
jgi:hypothetical protein